MGPSGPYTALTNVQDGTEGFQVVGTNTISFDFPSEEHREAATNGTTGHAVRARVTDTGTCTGPSTRATQIWYATGVVWLFEDALATGNAVTHDVHVGGATDFRTTHRIMAGNEGIRILDDGGLEPGSADLDFEIKGYFDFGTPSGFNAVIQHGGDVVIKRGGNDGELDASFLYPGNNCTLDLTGLTNGEHTFLYEVRPGAGTCRVLHDAVEVGTDSSVSGTMIDNVSDWHLIDWDVVNYMEFFKYSRGGSLIVHFEQLTLEDNITITDRAGPTPFNGSYAGSSRPGAFRSEWDVGHTVVQEGFQSTVTIDSSGNAAAQSDVVSDVSGSAEGTGFAGVSAPSSGLPGYTFLNQMAGKDYDPTQGGVQGIPIAFFYIVIAAAILIATLVAVLVTTRSLLFAAIGAGLMATLMVSVTIVSPWYLMWLAIPMALYFIVRGGIELN